MPDNPLVRKVTRPGGGKSIEIAPARPRRSLMVHNDSADALLLRFGTEPCTPASFSFVVPAKTSGGPFGESYDGAVQGCWNPPGQSGSGWAFVTELLVEG